MVYMIVASGIALEIHYCMGKQAGMDLYGSASDTCNRCGMKEKKTGCCHDEVKFVKLEDSHKNVSNDLNLDAGCKLIVTCVPEYQVPAVPSHPVILMNDKSPPEYSGPSACILNCVFLI